MFHTTHTDADYFALYGEGSTPEESIHSVYMQLDANPNTPEEYPQVIDFRRFSPIDKDVHSLDEALEMVERIARIKRSPYKKEESLQAGFVQVSVTASTQHRWFTSQLLSKLYKLEETKGRSAALRFLTKQLREWGFLTATQYVDRFVILCDETGTPITDEDDFTSVQVNVIEPAKDSEVTGHMVFGFAVARLNTNERRDAIKYMEPGFAAA